METVRGLSRMRLSRKLAPLAVAALLLASCSSNGTKSDNTSDTSANPQISADAPSESDIRALTASLSGGGASFPDSYYQAVNADFNKIAGTERVTYAKSGSSDGRSQLASGTLDFAGSDSLPKPAESYPGTLLFFPTVAAPITVSYHLDQVDDLRLSPDVIAAIFQAEITKWNDPKVAADNPDVSLPSTPISVVHRSDGSGTTNSFTKYLAAASPRVWKLSSGDEITWPAATQGQEKNSGVAEVIKQTKGAIGYVDLADAGKAGLSFALIRNSSGKYVPPSAAGVRAALNGADIAQDLTYNPLNGSDPEAYPLTAPTWLLVIAEQADAAKAETLRTYLRYALTIGQTEAAPTGYVALPEALAQRALEQVDRIG